MICKSCGAELPEGAKFCGNCGAPQAAEEQPPAEAAAPREPEPAAAPKKRKQKLGFGAYVLLFVIMFALGFGVRWIWRKLDPSIDPPAPTPIIAAPELALITPDQGAVDAMVQNAVGDALAALEGVRGGEVHTEFVVQPHFTGEDQFVMSTFQTVSEPDRTGYLSVYYRSESREVYQLIQEFQYDPERTGLTLDALTDIVMQDKTYPAGTGRMVYENDNTGWLGAVYCMSRDRVEDWPRSMVGYGLSDTEPVNADELMQTLRDWGFEEVPADAYQRDFWIG